MKKYIISILFIILCITIIPILPINQTNNTNEDNSNNIEANVGEVSSNINESSSKDQKTDDISNKGNQDNVSTDNDDKKDNTNKKENNAKKDVKETLNINYTQEKYTIYDEKSGKNIKLSPIDYIVGVVGAEMPVSFEVESLKAQAVAAHTNVIRLLGEASDAKKVVINTNPAYFQAFVTKEEMKDLYKDKFDEYYKKIYDAVSEVINEVIVYRKTPIVAAFFSMSSGKTEDSKNVWGSSLPYLKAVNSDAEKNLSNFVTTTKIKSNSLKQTLLKSGTSKLSNDKSQWVKVINTSPSGTVLELQFGSNIITGQSFRSMFGIKSAFFDINYNKSFDEFIISCKGYGHGVGLSQNGANLLAKKGYDYEEIIKHYYKDVSIVLI